VWANLACRNLTKSQKAMACAMIYPDADDASERGAKGGRGNKAVSPQNSFSNARLSLARTVLSHSPDRARAVLAGIAQLDAEYEADDFEDHQL
jgi:hypothetical protein